MSEGRELRTGWTTGTCAAAAARAAHEALVTGVMPTSATVTLPGGQTPTFPVLEPATGDGWAEAAVEKDAGDDPDVTHGALIRTRVALGPPGLRFHAGEGVGTVTKPGLPIPPGEPAINPVPRQMIAAALRDAGDFEGLDVTVSIPGGEALALRTWNPRLGIEGGLSILGTTGIVRPFSCAAWIASIHRGIDVAVATGLGHVVGATGATSEAAVKARHPDLPPHAFLDMGDFAGGLLKHLRRHPVPRLTVAGGPGKMSKLAQGALDLHSRRSQVDLRALARWSGRPEIEGANTALEAFGIGGEALAAAVARRAKATVLGALDGAPVAVELLVVDRQGAPLAHEPF